MNTSSFSLDDILNVLFAILILGYSLISILGGIFLPKKRVPKQPDTAQSTKREPTSLLEYLKRKQQEEQDDNEVDDDEQIDDELENEEQVAAKRPIPVYQQRSNTPPPPPQASYELAKRALPPEKKFGTEKFEFHSNLENFQQKTSIEDQQLNVNLHSSEELVSESLRMLYSEGTVYKKKAKKSVRQLIKSLPEEKLLFLSYEVFHVPVGKRETPFPWNN